MILDIPPHTAQMIIAKAQRQGVSVDELLQNFALDEPMLDSGDTPNSPLTVQDAQVLQNLPETPTPFMQELLAMGHRYA